MPQDHRNQQGSPSLANEKLLQAKLRQTPRRKLEVEAAEPNIFKEASDVIEGNKVVAVPPPCDDGQDLFEAESQVDHDRTAQVPVAAPSPKADELKLPSRATFAGRLQTEANAKLFDSRRELFWKGVPESFWKDHFEREFWKLCTDIKPAKDSEALAQFLKRHAIDSTATQACSSEVPRPKAKAKAKSKLPKEPGRGRGRGAGAGVWQEGQLLELEAGPVGVTLPVKWLTRC